MSNYWENRYQAGGNSGAGSYGEFADYKAKTINDYIIKYGIKTISDFGCGDGNQISLLKGYEMYSGFDVSAYAINLCINKFNKDINKKFYEKIVELPDAELCLSLDVIYHIYDEIDFQNYMEQLFVKSKKYVLIFSTDYDDNNPILDFAHHRKFTEYVNKNYKEFALIEEIDNFLQTSAKFYLYERK
jgi:hypothetical protein